MPKSIFFCYAHADEWLLNKLQAHLSPLQRQGLIDVWHDRDISAGAEWKQEINRHLDEADIILLLVSPDFMASDYCYSIEMKKALERHAKGETHVIPIILRPIYWQEALGRLQVLPTDGKPATDPDWFSLDRALLDITIGIRNVIKMIDRRSTAAEPNNPKKQPYRGKMGKGDIPLLEPFSVKSLCPYCIEWFYPGDCEIVSGLNPNIIIKQAPSEWKRHAARIKPESLADPKYVQASARRRCPNCQYILPIDIERADTIRIVVFGSGVATGKSHYIPALVHQLQTTLSHQVPFFYMAENKEVEANYRDKYFNSTLQNNNYSPIRSRPNTLVPLIYRISLEKKRINLALYDVAAEDIGDPNSAHTKCIVNASAIIFIVDPMAMPGIANQLPFHLRPSHIVNPKPSDALEVLVQVYKREQRLQLEIPLPVPIAITFTKSDLLRFIDQHYLFLRNPIHNDVLNLQDMEAVNTEVRTLLSKFGDRVLLEANQTFSNVSFFATSATGWFSPEEARFLPSRPVRCFDPLGWLLWKLQIIDAK